MTANDTRSQLDLIWSALHFYRAYGIPEGDKANDDQWSDLCSAMAYISEDRGEDY